MEIYNPRNTQAVDLYFRGEKMAKVMGSLASQQPQEGHRISGVLIKRGFNYHLIDPSDLSSESCDVMWSHVMSCDPCDLNLKTKVMNPILIYCIFLVKKRAGMCESDITI